MTDGKGSEDEAMNCGLSIAERDLLQVKLLALEDTVPPRAVWQRIEQQANAEGLLKQPTTKKTTWFMGAGLAAAVVLAVLNIPLAPFSSSGSGIDDDGFANNGEPVLRTEPAFEAVANNSNRTLNALMVQSQQIERNLRALPGQPRLVRASTAATIAGLEDRIAVIDFTLGHPDANLSPDQEERYWRERVRLMNSLLSMRTAQAQRRSF